MTTDPGADKAVQALPPLPEWPAVFDPGRYGIAFSAEQMHAYAIAALTHRQQGVVGQMRDALESIRAHCAVQPSALAKAIVATCDAALTASPPAQPRKQCSTCGATSYADALLACHRSAHGDCPGSKLWPDGDDAGPDAGQPAQPQSEPCAWCCGTGRFADHACRFCAGKAAGSVFAAQPPERAAQQRADYVPMPTSADEAAMMCLIGEAWLRENAPERLRAAQQEPNVMVRRAEGVAST